MGHTQIYTVDLDSPCWELFVSSFGFIAALLFFSGIGFLCACTGGSNPAVSRIALKMGQRYRNDPYVSPQTTDLLIPVGTLLSFWDKLF